EEAGLEPVDRSRLIALRRQLCRQAARLDLIDLAIVAPALAKLADLAAGRRAVERRLAVADVIAGGEFGPHPHGFELAAQGRIAWLAHGFDHDDEDISLPIGQCEHVRLLGSRGEWRSCRC